MGGGAGRLPVRTLNGMGCLPVRTLNGMGRLPGRTLNGMGRLPGRTLNGISQCVYIFVPFRLHGRILRGRSSSRPGKAGFRLKRDNFYHINTPSSFAGTI